MFATPAFAQNAAGTAGAPAGGLAGFLASPLPMMIAVFVIFYFLVIRPQQKRAKEQRATIDAVKKGDEVVTGGGILGRATKVDADSVEVEVAPGVKVRALKSTLLEVRAAGSKPAND
ncbi:preprotein translocase subunit YajC [Flavisphingomonas formosensis]|uniref:preprotein translocase subunit YajC n=1 Tax=Flavisphingomonas formosensis TaxID=861534 RepID=UPI0012FBE426|nr:preprotein translocase subunit YajC [Sphingomonas formosensis]